MSVDHLIYELKKNNIKIKLAANDKLEISMPKGEIDHAIIDQIKFNRENLITFLKEAPDFKRDNSQIPVIPENEYYELSYAQRRLWILNELDEQNVAYNMSGSLIIQGDLDVTIFEKAFLLLINRHEILRTSFHVVAGKPMQRVHSVNDLNFSIHFQDERNSNDQEQIIANLIRAENNEHFDLSKCPLLRGKLIQTHDHSYTYLFTIHHIISDAWSMDIIAQEITYLYNALKEGSPIGLSPLRIQYKDYASWQKRKLEDRGAESHREYWLNQFKNTITPLDLPTDYTRPAIKTYKGDMLLGQFDNGTSESLKSFASQNQASLFMTLLALVKTLLYKYCGQTDIVIGTPIAGRTHSDTHGQIGFYVNTLPLRTFIDGEKDFISLLQQIRNNTLDAYQHQMYPFDMLVDELNIERDLSRFPLFDVMVSLQAKGDSKDDSFLNGVHINKGNSNSMSSKFDISFFFNETSNGINSCIEYNTSIFMRSRIERLFEHLKELTRSVLTNENSSLNELKYITESEVRTVLFKFNRPGLAIEGTVKTVIDLFEAQVNESPDSIALVYEEGKLTYSELNAKANKLAAHLIEDLHVCPGDIVGVLLERSLDSVIAILAILKSSAVYLHLGEDVPVNRLRYIVNDANLKLILSDSRNLSIASTLEKQCIDLSRASFRANSEKNLRLHLQDGSYVIYTSGSTGVPKAIIQTHSTLYNLIQWQKKESGIENGLKYLQYSSFGFDVALQDMFFVLCTGGSLYIASERIRLDFTALLSYMQKEAIEVVYFPFSVLSNFFSNRLVTDFNLPDLKHIISAGEQLLIGAQLERFLKENVNITLHNHYGPAETHVVTTHSLKADKLEKRPPIGKPIDNSRIYIINHHNQLVPIGIPGEIWVGGTSLALGYLNHQEYTNTKFLSNTFSFASNERLYSTGDIGQWREDGVIEYLGRSDKQIKLRGHRIEIGELENVLLTHTDIQEVTIVVKGNDENTKSLVAYLVPKDSNIDLDARAIRNYLAKYLPQYMIPNHFITLAEFPLTANGKIAVNNLPDPFDTTNAKISYHPPRTLAENKLVLIWQEVLGRNGIGIFDNFFELGGHSLKANRIVSSINSEFQVNIKLKEVFVSPTIAELSEAIERAKRKDYEEIEPVQSEPHYDLSHAQLRMMILHELDPDLATYNLTVTRRWTDYLNEEIYRRVFEVLYSRHESLRTVFKVIDGVPQQVILPIHEFSLNIAFLDFTQESGNGKDYKDFIKEYSVKPFDFENGPLVRNCVITLGERNHILIFQIHHILVDGYSIEILSNEFLILYNAFANNAPNPLPELNIQYKDFAAWQNKLLANGSLDRQRDYWMEKFQGDVPVLNLTTDFVRPSVKTYNGAAKHLWLETELVGTLKKISIDNSGSLFMALLTVVKIVLSNRSNQNDIIVGTPIAGREHKDLDNQVGLYINTIALRTKIKSDDTFDQLFKKVKEETLGAYENQAYPFDKLIKELELRRDASRSPLFDVMVALQNTDLNSQERKNKGEHDLLINVLENQVVMSKFDLGFYFKEIGEGAMMSVEYNTDLFTDKTIGEIMDEFQSIVKMLETKRDTLISQLCS